MSTLSSNIPSKKTGIYPPLPQFRKLNLDKYTVYGMFTNYVLTFDQFNRCGFPSEDPEKPGTLLMLDNNPRLASRSIFRRCIRCSSDFYVLSDGTYSTADGATSSMCRYHLRRGHPDYPCCDDDSQQGCYENMYHVTTQCPFRSIRFFPTKKNIHFSSSVYGLDCEMIFTTAGMEVAKVGVVGADGLPVYESFVRPENQILDYNTAFSGITKEDLEHVTTTISDVQDHLLKLLNEDSILVGHGLENDLLALRLFHRKVVDTTEVFKYGPKGKKSLKNLAQEYLNKDIQESSSGHSCIEDARTCMELMWHRIELDLQQRPPVTQEANMNSMLQNIPVPASQPIGFCFPTYSSVYYPLPYSGNCFYEGFLMPENQINIHPGLVAIPNRLCFGG